MTNHPVDITPRHHAWLASEVSAWQRAELIGPDQATAILARYRPGHRFSLARLGLMLGGAFVGVGVLWLVAANLEQLSPLARFSAVVLLWLGVAVGAELVAVRPGHSGASPLVGALRGLTALLFGAVVMQAAQSLQVPAWEPSLVGWWGLGALIHAYAVRGVAPLVVGLVTSTVWLLWHVVEVNESGLAVVLTLGAAGALAAAIGVLHSVGRLSGFAAAWREIGALTTLIALFVAALPDVDTSGFRSDVAVWALPAAAAAAVVLATVLARGSRNLEALGSLAAAGLAVILVLWETGGSDTVAVGDWVHAAVSVAGFVLVAAWFAVVGIRRDSARLTYLAIGALVLFTTVQSFAVFAEIIEGAWLFVTLGLIFLATGYAADRGRRRLAAALEGASA